MPKTKGTKREEAAERQEYWSELSTVNMLVILEERPGKSEKQVEKLLAKLETELNTKKKKKK